MNWIVSNLAGFVVLGLIALIASFQCSAKAWRRLFFWGGTGSTLVGLASAVLLAISAPGGEMTIHQPIPAPPSPLPTRPSIPVPAGPLEPLRREWSSEDVADWPAAEVLASICQNSYLSPIDAEEALRARGFTRVVSIVHSSMIGYVASVDGTAVIVLRGTDNDVDWLVNLNARSTRLTRGWIHTGFYRSYQSLKPQIVKALDQCEPRHLWITGHSLGGALAVVCACDLVDIEGRSLDGLVTFGQPMVMAGDLAAHSDRALVGRYAHYVNDEDIVPRTPPGYAHFGSLVWFTKTGVQRSKPRLMFGAGAEGPPASEELETLTPLTGREFEQLQDSLRGSTEQRLSKDPPVFQGVASWISHHDMGCYLEKVRESTRRTASLEATQPESR